MNREHGLILKIKVNSTSTQEVLTSVKDYLTHNNKFYIVTPNPELILMAQKNEKLKNALNKASISVPDGVGLKITNPSLKIIKGRKLFIDLIKLAKKEGWKIFLLGGMGKEAEKAAKLLRADYKNLNIEFEPGPKLNNQAQPVNTNNAIVEKEAVSKINKFAPDLLFVAFGNPKQEIWIYDNLSKLEIGGAMAVGGTFRYIAGLSKLPPKWMEQFGLEWLFRLFSEPKRIGRIINAVIGFPVKYFISKIS